MGDRLKNRFKGISTPNIDEDLNGINDIIKATREGNFSSPYIHSPEKIEGTFTDAPRKREASSLLQGLTRGAVSPFLGAYQELGQSGDAFKQGKIGSGIADLLKGTLHTAMTPVTSPLGAVFEGLKGSGEVGGEVAKGLEQTMNLPFDAIKQGSELVKQVVESTGLDISDGETSKKFNDLAVEVGGLIALGKGHREAKKYVESKVPELKQVKNTEAEIDIKPVESKPVEGLTQEKLPNEILKPKEEVRGNSIKDEIAREKENIDLAIESAKLDKNKQFEGVSLDQLIKDKAELEKEPASYFFKMQMRMGEEFRRTKNPDAEFLHKEYQRISDEFQKQLGDPNEKVGDIIEVNTKPENLNLNISPKRAVLYQENKIAIKEILDKEGLLTPEQISRRLTSLKEQGKIRDKVSVGTIKLIADEIKAGQEKPKIQEIKGTPNTLDIALPEEMNSRRAVSFDRRSGLTVKEVLEENPEFKPYVKDLKDIDEVTTQLSSLYWKKRYNKPLPELPKEEEVSFDFGENAKNIETPKIEETTSIKNEVVNKEREFRGLDPLETEMKRDWGTVWDEAKVKIDKGEIDPKNLTKELAETPRPVTDTESAILTYDRVKIKEEHAKLLEEVANDPSKREQLLQLEEQLNLNDLASKQVGTETGRALAIRKMEIKDDYTLAPLIQKARVANKGEVVPEEVRFKLEELSKEIADKQKLFDKEKDKVELLKAEKVLLEEQLKQRTEKRTVKKEALDSEYENLIKEFASTMQLNVLVDPKQIQLMTKMALNRLQKGELTIEQIVDQVYQVTKQYVKELTKEDVMTAISGAGRFIKMTEPELQKRIRDIKKAEGSDQAKLQKSYKTRLENRRKEYENMLETGNFEKTPKRKTQMTPELLKLRDEVDVLKQRADREIRLLELKNRTGSEKVKDTVIDVGNIPRTLLASFDLSAPFRQGLVLLASHPYLTFKQGGAFREMFRYFGSDKALRDLQRYIEDSPNASLYIKSKLYLANEKANIGRVSSREEAFISTLPDKIPVFGHGVRASNRAYAGFLDKLRMDVFDSYVEHLNKGGITFESNPKAFKQLGAFINQATGRGTLAGFERSAAAASIFLFSPRLIASRLQLMNIPKYFTLDPAIRGMVAKDMIKFVGAGLTTLGMAKLAGAEVETDPRSTDFGKIKIGNTRIDVLGGFQQYIVPIAKIITNRTKTQSGKIVKLDGQQFPFTTQADVVGRLIRTKVSPSVGFGWDWLDGEDMMGNKFELPKDAFDLVTPLLWKDLAQASQEEDINATLLSLPAIFGVGVQTYKNKKPALK